MKYFVVLALVAAVAAESVDFTAPIVKSSYDISPEGNFQYAYETGNGIVAQADGVVKNANSENAELEVNGAYSYKSPEGENIQVTYVANEQGYQPQGSHIPVPPPIPVAIQRSLDWIAAHPPAVETVAKNYGSSIPASVPKRLLG